MVDSKDHNVGDEDYDEENDSDFEGQASDAGSESSSDDPGNEKGAPLKDGGRKPSQSSEPLLIEELDSGDEATIKERQKRKKKKQKRRKAGDVSSDEDENEGWRAKTRSMRAQEQVDKQRRTFASLKDSTIDVNKIWEEMNKPGPLPPVCMEGEGQQNPSHEEIAPKETEQKNATGLAAEEMITIKRQFKFAGEVHIEEKVVPKSSAEAQLWLAQQENKTTQEKNADERQRPLRKISRFDPNYSNHEAFRNHAIKVQPAAFRGPKLNVVEKSKMDWATHVDAEGLKDELDVHAKAKDAYHNRMDFLNQVEQRKEEEARLARQRG